jgi:hypothetical protein
MCVRRKPMAAHSSVRDQADGPVTESGAVLEKGEELVRFAYSTGGTARRGPVTLRRSDLERLRKSLEKTPRLKAALGL